MKRFLNTLLICCVLLFSQITALSQDAPPPPPPQGDGDSGPVGGSAPIGDGTLILIMLASGYLLFRLRKYNLETKAK